MMCTFYSESQFNQWFKFTIEHPVSLLLAFISMDSHSRPSKSKQGFKFSCVTTSQQKQYFSFNTYPSLLILLVRSSHRLLVSTKMMVLFSFSLIISSSRRMSLQEIRHSVSKTEEHILSPYSWHFTIEQLLTCSPSRHHCTHPLSAGCYGLH